MTSAEFETVLISQITIPEERQRKDFGDISDLALSIKRLGLIHPPVVTREHVLIAGHRRFLACSSLGWTSIPIQYADTLDPLELRLLELEENTKRKDLTWQEQNDAIADYHSVRKELDPEWNETKTADALNLSAPTISKHLTVAKAREEDESLNAKQKFSEAHSLASRKKERALASIILEDEPEDSVPLRGKIQQGDFLKWSATPLKQRFNFIHCDFPYGVDATKEGQSAAKTFGGYDDSAGTYAELLATFVKNQDNFVAESAHMMFWFSMNYFQDTVSILSTAGWTVDPFPLIWYRSDHRGMLPDANRRARRVYETALHCTRGDRKIVGAKPNCFPYPTEKLLHASEKPKEMLRHFFQMFIDESSFVFDPTAGSGNAVKIGMDLGAAYSFGLELNADYAAAANKALNVEP